MYDNVLIPTDGSDTVPETLAHGLSIAANNDATVHALYVVDRRITTAADETSRSELTATLEAEGREAIATVANQAAEAGLDTQQEIRQGTPSKEILDYTDEAAIDLIVIGTRGKTPREKITTLGSVSERVVDNASIPVFVVRNAGANEADSTRSG